MKLHNFVSGQWVEGNGTGESIIDPVTGEELARISSQGVDLEAALAFARTQGGPGLRQLTYAQRAEMLPLFLNEIETYLALKPVARAKPTPLFSFSISSPNGGKRPLNDRWRVC